MKIVKDEFLKDKAVEGFIKHLANLINSGENSFLHNYKNRNSDMNWSCNSLQDALQQYYWKHKSYTETKEVLDDLKIQLCDSYELNNEYEFKNTCIKILEWGGVLQYNTEWLDNKINSGNGLIEAFTNAKNILTKDVVNIDSKDWNKTRQQNTCNFRMNAGYTKIYSLLCENFIIYDSRVAAAIGKLVVEYLLEYKEKNKMFSRLDDLTFRIMTAKEGQNCETPKNRDPSHQGLIKFQRMNNSGSIHAEWNVKANWILTAAIEQANMQWKDNEGNDIEAKDRLRALEAALFMIGYDLPLSTREKSTSHKIGIAESIKQVEDERNMINLNYGGRFNVDELVNYIRQSERDFIIQGQIACSLNDHNKPKSLDYWLRKFAVNPNMKQADNKIIAQLVKTGLFIQSNNLSCPDSGKMCKGVVIA